MDVNGEYRLLADRVLSDGSERTIDLVTGAHVLLRITPIAPDAAQRTWAERCARWYTWRHPRGPILRDYGVIGMRGRFEAIDMSGARKHHPRPHGPFPTDATRPAQSRRAHRLQPRRAVARVAAWLDETDTRPVRELHVCGPTRAGLSTTAELVAREGRLRGFVPVSASVLASLPADLHEHALQILSARHLLVLRDPGPRDRHDSVSLDCLARRAERPLAIVTFAHRAPADVSYVPLDPLDVEALMHMIDAERLNAADRRRARSCAERSGGSPGRFLEAWRRTGAARYRVQQAGLLKAAERAPRYGDAIDRVSDGAESETMARSVIDRATRLAESGRHAAARAALHDCAAQLERRASTLSLARVRLALGELTRARGSASEAIRELDFALAAAPSEGADQLRTEIMAGLCRALIDQGDLRRAESIARVVHATRRMNRPSTAVDRHSTQVLAAALYWQGRYDEADSVLHGHGDEDAPALALRARIALARGDLADAASLAQHALSIPAPDHVEARLSAIAAAIVIAGATADPPRVQTLSMEALALARRIRQPVWMIEIRLARMEALIRAHDLVDARAAARGLRRVAARRRLRLMSARARTLLAALEPARPDTCDHDGFQALADLYGALTPAGSRSPRRRIRDDLAELIELAQEAPDERTALHRIATFMAGSLPHATISFFAKHERAVSLLVATDPTIAVSVPDVARRAVDAGLLVGPSRGADGVDVALPIRFAGAIIGALFCRWSVEGPLDWTRIEVLLAAGASAAGPCVCAMLDRRPDPARMAVPDLIGASRSMDVLRDQITRAANAPFAVLIEGESGAGKELVARAIHRASPRRDRKWCAMNCAALNDDLLEAELFGHARGAFTGAIAERPGLLEDADGGTVFLDEVGELSPRAQAKLLRTLQEGEVRRLGQNTTRRVDVRVVAATNRRLAEDVAAGRFREDLWYRLAIIRISVPPLRARPDDVPPLVNEFWRRAADRTGSKAVLTAATVAALARYDWPGNVRELQNVLAALSVSAPRRGPVTPAHLPDAIMRTAAAPASLDEARRMFERRFVRAAMARAGGRVAVAARELGISRQGLTKLLARLDRGEGMSSDAESRSVQP